MKWYYIDFADKIIANTKVYCINNSIKNNKNANISDKKYSEGLANFNTNNIYNNTCNWIEKINELNTHLKQCKYITKDCILNDIGCKHTRMNINGYNKHINNNNIHFGKQY